MTTDILLQDLYTILVLGGSLLLGLLLTVYTKLNLRIFQGVYLLLGAINVLAYYFMDLSILYPVVYFIVGELAMVLMLGIMGKTFSPKNYAAIMFAIGLFPWALNMGVTIIYLVILMITTAAYAHFKNISGFKNIGQSFSDPLKAVKKMSSEDLSKFREKATVTLGTPFLISTILAFIAFIFLF